MTDSIVPVHTRAWSMCITPLQCTMHVQFIRSREVTHLCVNRVVELVVLQTFFVLEVGTLKLGQVLVYQFTLHLYKPSTGSHLPEGTYFKLIVAYHNIQKVCLYL